jgi:ParB/RepB/Spo0J family partition protein
MPMPEKWKKFAEEIVEEVGGGPLSPEVEAAIAEATRLAEGGAPAHEPLAPHEPTPVPTVSPIQTTLIPLGQLKDSPYQMRREMDGDELEELTRSIAKKGLETPITVREKDGEIQIVCGHRRVQAFRRLQFNGQTEEERQRYSAIPAFVAKGLPDAAMATTGWVDNVLRSNLSPIEMALGLVRIKQLHDLTTAKEVSELTGVLPEKVKRLLRIGNAPAVVQQGMAEGILVPISPDVLAADERPDNEKTREVRRTLQPTDAIAFTRMHEGLVANAGNGELAQEDADQQTAKAIHQALTANWSSRQIETFVARALGTTKQKQKKTRSQKCFKVSKWKLVLDLRRAPKLAGEDRKALRKILEPIWNALKDE